jgi:hypothetical protein
MNNSALHNLIQSAVEGDVVNLKSICDTLDVKLKADKALNDLCRMGVDGNDKIVIWINPKVDAKTKFTFVAIALAEYILYPNRITNQGVNYDMFFLKDLNTKKNSRQIMLATRLAIPEHIIEKLSAALEVQFTSSDSKNTFDANNYIANSKFLPEFIRCVIKESSSLFLLDNLINTYK